MSKITQLNSKSTLIASDIVPIIDTADLSMSSDGSNKKITLVDLSNSVADLITDSRLDGKKLKVQSVTAGKIAAETITGDKLVASTITGDKIAGNTITSNKIAANTITSNQIPTDSISGASIASDTITGSKLAIATITGDRIAAETITANNIVTGTITADKIAAGVLSALAVTTNSITTDKIVAGSITGDRIASYTITAINIAASAITTDKLQANSITTDKLQANSITAINIAASAITAGKIAAGAIASNSMLASNIVAANNLVTDFVLTKNIQSDNFNGQIINNLSNTNSITSRTINVGTSGYYLDSQSGTIVASKFIARDGIIAGNYIKYNNNGAFEVDAQGNLGVKVDDDTLAVSNGSLVIKQVPSTSIVVATQDINYLGGLNTTAYDVLTTTNPNSSTSMIVSPENIWCVYDSLSNVQSGLNITGGELYHAAFTVNFSNVVNLAAATSFIMQLRCRWSDSPTSLLNTPGEFTGIGTFVNINNPVLPLGPVTYTIPKIIIPKTTIPTNRYIIIAPSFSLFGNNLSGTVSISAASTINTSLIFKASGQITNPNNSFSSLVKSKGLKIDINA